MRNPVIKCLGVGIALAVCAASSPSSAGSVYNPAVTINRTTGYFSGTITAARYSSDSNQQMGCYTAWGIPNSGGTPFTSCWAEDAAGNFVSCGTSDANFAAVAGRVNSTTDLDVYFNTSGTCTQIYVENGSAYIH